jgi:hypothetical protein
MSYLTYEDARRFARGLSEERLIKSAAAKPAGADAFISYSSLDKEFLRGVERIFVGRFASFYVDRRDKTLPRITSTRTASSLATQIQAARRLVVLVSPNSHRSRWIPWELGLAHGVKGPKYVATFPISPTGEEDPWGRQEYLGLYPQITWHDSKRTWIVTDPDDGKYWTLTHWLHETELD